MIDGGSIYEAHGADTAQGTLNLLERIPERKYFQVWHSDRLNCRRPTPPLEMGVAESQGGLSRRFNEVRNKALPIIAAMVHWVCATLACEATRHAGHVRHTSTWKPATRCWVNSPVAGKLEHCFVHAFDHL
mmetsp:Transcript_21074/g.31778  ORF Transcript_21074/g.31778 Transcript_21074/m.31778 type:complete len:131 (+) Transcript_21074:223-615(+)